MIGIEDTDEIDDKNVSHNPIGTSLSYSKQQLTNINTCRDSKNSYKAHNNIIISETIYDTKKEHMCFEENVSSGKKDSNSLQLVSNIHEPCIAFPNKHNEGQVRLQVKSTSSFVSKLFKFFCIKIILFCERS